jgi:hypothetical protein
MSMAAAGGPAAAAVGGSLGSLAALFATQKQEVVDLLQQGSPRRVKDIGPALGFSDGRVGVLLASLINDGRVSVSGTSPNEAVALI